MLFAIGPFGVRGWFSRVVDAVRRALLDTDTFMSGPMNVSLSDMVLIARRRLRSAAFGTIVALTCLSTPLTIGLPALAQIPAATVIDGARNPELIPDWRAYSVLFRLVSNRSGRELDAIRAYLRQIDLGRQGCESCSVSPTQVDRQVDIIIATAEEYSKRADDLDTSLRDRLNRNPNLSLDAELRWLRQEKEALCTELISLLRTRLGSTDAEKLLLHIEAMKRKITLVYSNR